MRRDTVAAALFYGLLTTTMALVLFEGLTAVLPSAVAVRVGHNSEAYVMALALAAWIQFARLRLGGTQRQWPVTLVVAGACLAIGVWLLASDYPSRFKTLNESFLALAVLIPYVQRSRQPSAVQGAVLSASVAVVMLVGGRTMIVTDLAEALGALLLLPLALNVVDRGILDDTATTSPPLRWSWYAGLLVAPLAFSYLQYGLGLGGPAEDVTRYVVRFHEAFVFVLLLQLYLAVGLRRTGSRGRDRQPGRVLASPS